MSVAGGEGDEEGGGGGGGGEEAEFEELEAEDCLASHRV